MLDISLIVKDPELPLTLDEMHVLGFLDMKNGRKAGSFTNALIDAIFRADFANFRKLHEIYPELAEAVCSWQYGNLAERSGNATEPAGVIDNDIM